MRHTVTVRQSSKKTNMLETEAAIFFIKQNFQRYLADSLNLCRVSAPLFVSGTSGMQDNLNGTERPISFCVSAIRKERYEVVHSLAKWKRHALQRYEVEPGSGIYTDMNAIRPDEETLSSRMHSVYVDQWDWEKAITGEQRNPETLKAAVKAIYDVLKRMEQEVGERYGIEGVLPEDITFIHASELAKQYPTLTPKQREDAACLEWGSVFLMGIGGDLGDGTGTIHDGRAPDYDDWSTPTSDGHRGLNGDILVWNPVLARSFELSSMGIRVDKAALLRQLEIRNCLDRLDFPWHRQLVSGQLPESMGGGIGQSRLCMFLLRREHIGEVQAGVWPHDVQSQCASEGIQLL
ncbi:MAG: aspartate--ammonia ligase [bacterium]|nr:aspartate--ammonia ligase [bacterium]